MRPVETADSNMTYKLPGGTEQNDLPCERVVFVQPQSGHKFVGIRSVWELDTDEVVELQQSHRVELTVYMEPIPPVALRVASEDQHDWETPIARAHLRRAVFMLVDRLRDMGYDPASPEDVIDGLEECLLATAKGDAE